MTNPFEHFLDIKVDPKKPDFYKVFGLGRNSSPEDIKQKTDRVIATVRSQKPGDHAKEWAALIDLLTRAKTALLKKHLSDAEGTSKNGKSKPNTSASQKKATLTAGKSENAKESSASNGKKDADSFKLDPPEEDDSFDSDTHLSAKSFQGAEVFNETVDPMAPIEDPTSGWDEYRFDPTAETQATGGTAMAVVTPAQTVGQPSTIPSPVSPSPMTPADASPAPEDQVASDPSTISDPSNTAAEPFVAPVAEKKTFYSETYKKKSRAAVMIGGILLAAIAVGGVSWAVISNLPDGKKTASNDSGDDKEKDSEGEKKPDEKGASSKNTTGKGKNEKANSEKKTKSVGENLPKQSTDPNGKMANGKEPTKKMETKSKEPETKTPDSTTTKTTPTTNPNTNTTNPTPENKTPEAKPKISEIAQLASLLTEVKQKLSDRDLINANRLLDKAGELTMLADHQAKYERLKSVTGYYEKFWNVVVEGCGKLKGLDEIKISDTTIVSIVESSEDKIIYRALGQRFEKSPRELQTGLAMKIAEKELDATDAETRVIKGTVFAVEGITNPDRLERAREIWEEAKIAGAETDELVLYLDDTYDLLADFIEKSDIPEDDAIQQAQVRFRERYAAELKTVSRNQANAIAFATTLQKEVPSLDDAADRYANFVASAFYAAKGGDLELAMNVLSDWNKWFSIELEKQTFETLTSLNKGRLKSDQKAAVAQVAIEYMQRAQKANDSELELQFAELALTAARGARNPQLVQSASAEVKRIKAEIRDNDKKKPSGKDAKNDDAKKDDAKPDDAKAGDAKK